MEQFDEYLITHGKKSKSEVSKIEQRIKDILTYCAQCSVSKIPKLKNTFELMGVDIMFDQQFNPYLIEFNMNPALDTSTKG